jgi:hypothetical protein
VITPSHDASRRSPRHGEGFDFPHCASRRAIIEPASQAGRRRFDSGRPLQLVSGYARPRSSMRVPDSRTDTPRRAFGTPRRHPCRAPRRVVGQRGCLANPIGRMAALIGHRCGGRVALSRAGSPCCRRLLGYNAQPWTRLRRSRRRGMPARSPAYDLPTIRSGMPRYITVNRALTRTQRPASKIELS